MKETIGEKIKRLRKEMGLTQENVHNNQSQISQIESGRITNPDENTLLLIAKNMEITFDELISDTTWVKPEAAYIGKEIAISPNEINVEVDGKGNIDWSYRQYPLYNDKGEKREFCPKSGQKLIFECTKCRRQVEESKQIYCFGCGTRILPEHFIPEKLLEIVPAYSWFDFRECQIAIVEVVHFKSDEEKLITDNYEKLFGEELMGEAKKQINKVDEKAMEKPIAKLWEKWVFEHGFNVQIAAALEKKLRNTYETLSIDHIDDTPKNIDEIKAGLMSDIAFRINIALTDDNPIRQALGQPPREIPSVEMMMEMLKDLSTTQDSDKLIEKLQSKIDLNTGSDEDSNDEKISEDGNSETDAAENADRNNKNADNQNKKEA